jgi:hypothetical protein
MKNLMSLFLVVCFTLLGTTAQAKNALSFNNTLKVATDTTALVEFKGKYNFGNGAPVTDVTVVIDKDGLLAKSAEGNFVLKPVEKKADNFTIEEISAEVVFTRNEEKKIVGISVKMTDGTIIGKREEAK